MYDYDDEVGFDEIEDEIEEVGAPRRGRRRSKSRRRSRSRSRVRNDIKRAVLTGDTAPEVGFRPLGLGSGKFIGGTTTEVNLDAIVQDPFIPVRPVCVVTYDSTWDGGLVMLDDVKIGTKSQLLGVEGGPAAAFSPDANNIQLKGDLAGAGLTINAEFSLSGAATLGNAYVAAWIMGVSQG